MNRLLLIGLLPLAACAARTASDDAVTAANARLESRFNAGDYAAVAAMYEDDAVLLGPGGRRIAGREAIDAYWIRPWVDARWELTVRGIEGSAEMPVQRGRSVLRYDREGEPVTSDVEFVLVWRRQSDGSYRIAVDAWWKE